MNTIIKNIKELIYFEDKCLYGEEMKIKVIKAAFIKIKNDIFNFFFVDSCSQVMSFLVF